MNAQLVVGDDLFQVYLVDVSQTLAPRTRTFRRVEREDVRRRIFIRDARRGTHEPFREEFTISSLCTVSRLVGDIENHDKSFALFHSRRHTLSKPLFGGVAIVFDGKLVDDHFDVVVLVPVYLHATHNLLHHSVNANVQVAFLAHALEEFAVMSFSVANEWSQYQYALALIFFENHPDHTLLGVFHHLLARHVAVSRCRTCIEHAQVVVDFCGGTYCRAWVLVGSLLFDADDGRQSRNLVNVRTLHVAQKVACVGRESLNVSSLSFGKNGVERQ